MTPSHRLAFPSDRLFARATRILDDAADEGDPDYEEGAEFVKLRYPEGEVDFVAATLLTRPGAEPATVQGREIRLETDVEIVAKKLFFRGDRFKARDVFDLAMLLTADHTTADQLAPWASRHHDALVRLIIGRPELLRSTFEAIDVDGFTPRFDDAVALVGQFLRRQAS